MLHPNQFERDEAWVAFQLNGEPIRTEQDGDLNCIALMEASSCFILGMQLVKVRKSGPTVRESRELLQAGVARSGTRPKTLFVPSEQVAERLVGEAERANIAVVRIPDVQLLSIVGEARTGFTEHLNGGRR